ncbi:hypothetical protein [Ferrimonas futtsuensis]|uniref:hypothetical protein n=1 Tax=Ferrimonas futtsuensis TaxID=364764 RepID=UPI0004141F2D|nr:hypothetical protein [Ferrimonas futtsuensis]
MNSDLGQLEYDEECTLMSEDAFYDLLDQCYDQVDDGSDLNQAQAEQRLEAYRSCLSASGLPRATQQACIDLSKRSRQQAFAAMDSFFGQLAQTRGTEGITLPLPPDARLVNHVFPEDFGGKMGNITLTLASAVFDTDLEINQVAEYYRIQVGEFLEYRHGDGTISFIEGAGMEVKEPAELLKAQMTKPNIQILHNVDPMTGDRQAGAQVTLFYNRL